MTPSSRTTLAFLLVALLAAPLGASATPATQVLAGNVSPRLAEATLEAPADPLAPMHLVIGLRLGDSAGLAAFLAQTRDSAAPRFLSTDELAARFGPRAADARAVEAWLAAEGFRVTPASGDRILVDADGTAAQVEATFGVRLGVYALGGRHGIAADREPQVPATLAPLIGSVGGLDGLALVHAQHEAARPAATLGGASAYAPADLAHAYNLQKLYNASITGRGRTVGIATAYDFKSADLAGFDAQWKLAAPNVSRACVDGACAFDANAGSDETTLDVETASATARGASVRVVIGANAQLATFTDVYHAAANDASLGVVSTSWGMCETEMPAAVRATDDDIFAAANARGQTWFAASGDSGSADCSGARGVDYPASSPGVTGVGGTSLKCARYPACTGHGTERAWSGSGGGASAVYAKPAWQSGPGVPADGARDVPDVALTADPNRGTFVLFEGAWYSFGGASEAAPQWAGMWTLLQQAKNATMGNANARLYALGGTSAFYNVTSGCNGDFCAAKGYDEVTGLGAFNAYNLLRKW